MEFNALPDVFQPLVRSLFSTATAYSIFMDGGVVGVKRGRGRPGVGGRKKRWSWWGSCVWNEQIFRYHKPYFVLYMLSILYSAFEFQKLVLQCSFCNLWNLSNNHLVISSTWSNNFYHHRVICRNICGHVVKGLDNSSAVWQQRANASKKGVRRLTNSLATLSSLYQWNM